MRRFALLVIALALGLIAGCGKETAIPTVAPSPVPTIPAAMLPTAPPAGPTVMCRAAPRTGLVEGLPPVTEEDWSRGSADAAVTLIEYSDFQ